ncbi:Conserved hypothetical protein [Clostridium acetobutylicum EA 2018]|uniref:Uncharacterized protein n=3 Tax=Clostridiaceae TaxID=31979 RepID=Q97JY7_CLOAB|nr:hypothetical protein [Clostridium acetobutylicum]ADZ20184.1 Conserved hypothetical protein [Clostridium acetobutylicum EA 2018]PSM04923.1 hypothetical protein C7T89_16375 [Clostridium sp. NJ4]AAK79108.1 Hypothetical protein CA_C1135 [Clostridium acetobutylicum ATCC 824]AEI31644.1 hypothetical protein SMB_G1154 [Clostridium acetobutylicum DSM 1731]AWV81638.1 hypothetical protein DK921_16380 [Clostridium acetobutylicum]
MEHGQIVNLSQKHCNFNSYPSHQKMYRKGDVVAVFTECIKCNKRQKLSSFYVNKLNKTNEGHDFWCKKCVSSFVKDKNSLIEYCKKNRRLFKEDLWSTQSEKIKNKYKNNLEFENLSAKQQKDFLLNKTIKGYFGSMNRVNYYSYDQGQDKELLKKDIVINRSISENVKEKDKKPKKIYSQKWIGTYTQEQLDYLNDYYEDCLKDFNIVTRNHKDYARKIAKASLVMDESYNDMMNGISGADKRYKEAKAIFDSLSTSAKFSEKTRSINDSAGFDNLGEIILNLEQNGYLAKKIIFDDPDDVDKISADFRWTLNSIGDG